MAQNVRNVERNTNIVRRHISGETLREISKALNLSYSSTCGIKKREYQRVHSLLANNRRSVEDISKEYGVSSDAVIAIVSVVNTAEEEAQRRMTALDQDLLEAQERYFRECAERDSSFSWRPIESCPEDTDHALVSDGNTVQIAVRSVNMKWLVGGSEYFPTHWLPMPCPSENGET